MGFIDTEELFDETENIEESFFEGDDPVELPEDAAGDDNTRRRLSNSSIKFKVTNNGINTISEGNESNINTESVEDNMSKLKDLQDKLNKSVRIFYALVLQFVLF